MARLYVLSGADIGRTLDVESSASIGRIAGCDLVLRDASISRRHARVERGSAGWEVIDEDSRNGITVAGARVQRAALADGLEFKLGEVLLRFRESVAQAAATAPPVPRPSAAAAPPAARAPAPAPAARARPAVPPRGRERLAAVVRVRAAPALAARAGVDAGGGADGGPGLGRVHGLGLPEGQAGAARGRGERVAAVADLSGIVQGLLGAVAELVRGVSESWSARRMPRAETVEREGEPAPPASGSPTSAAEPERSSAPPARPRWRPR